MDITFNDVAQKIPSYALCNMIGNDSETVYILDLTTKQNLIQAMKVGTVYMERLTSILKAQDKLLKTILICVNDGQHSTRQKRQIMV